MQFVAGKSVHYALCLKPVLYSSILSPLKSLLRKSTFHFQGQQCDAMKRNEVSVVIVGAGVAGISTARHLFKAGFSKLTILEASNRDGGRIMSVYPGDGVVELGATVIHGATPENPVFKLATEWGMTDSLKIDRISGEIYRENGKIVNRDLVDQLWKRYQKLEDDIGTIYMSKTQSPCPNTMSFEEFIQREKPKIVQEFPEEQREDVSSVFNLMLNYCRFMNGDDLSKLSASLGGCYKTFPGEEMVFAGKGYAGFFQRMKEGIPAEVFHFNAEVTRICWDNEGQVKVTCKNGDIFNADHVVVTCSLGHLKYNHKQMFDPPLPESKAGAIDRTGFGRVNKLFLYYDEPFTKKGVNLAWDEHGHPFEKTSRPTWAKDLMGFEVVPTNPKAFGGSFAGNGAEIMEQLSDEEIATECTDLLRKFLNDPSIPRPIKVLRSRWISDPLFRGSYTYLSNRNQDNDIADIAAPLPSNAQPKLQFAGEATHSNYYSTIHGAYLSAVRESQRLIELYRE